MDYAGGSELWKYQWDLLHNPEKILFAWAQDEEEGAMVGLFYEGIDIYHLALRKNNIPLSEYSTESTSEDIEVGCYTLIPHYNEDNDGIKKLSYYLGWRYIKLGQGENQKQVPRIEYIIAADELKEFQNNINLYQRCANLFYIAGVPNDDMLEYIVGIKNRDLNASLSALGDMWAESLTNPYFYIEIVNLYAAPKFIKPAGSFVGSLFKAIPKGLIATLEKCGRLGYKVKKVGLEIALYTNLNIEIARFSSANFKPTKWIKTGTVISDFDGFLLKQSATGEVGFDIGFKARRQLSSNVVNDYHVKLFGNDAPYTASKTVTDRILNIGDKFYVIEYKSQSSPGRFGSKNKCSTISEMRNKYAIKEEWKNLRDGEIVVREYEVIQSIKVRDGPIGSQIENGTTYTGGGQQYEFLNDLSNNKWKKYLKRNDFGTPLK